MLWKDAIKLHDMMEIIGHFILDIVPFLKSNPTKNDQVFFPYLTFKKMNVRNAQTFQFCFCYPIQNKADVRTLFSNFYMI